MRVNHNGLPCAEVDLSSARFKHSSLEWTYPLIFETMGTSQKLLNFVRLWALCFAPMVEDGIYEVRNPTSLIANVGPPHFAPITSAGKAHLFPPPLKPRFLFPHTLPNRTLIAYSPPPSQQGYRKQWSSDRTLCLTSTLRNRWKRFAIISPFLTGVGQISCTVGW